MELSRLVTWPAIGFVAGFLTAGLNDRSIDTPLETVLVSGLIGLVSGLVGFIASLFTRKKPPVEVASPGRALLAGSAVLLLKLLSPVLAIPAFGYFFYLAKGKPLTRERQKPLTSERRQELVAGLRDIEDDTTTDDVTRRRAKGQIAALLAKD